jgi:hypothetical protein
MSRRLLTRRNADLHMQHRHYTVHAQVKSELQALTKEES